MQSTLYGMPGAAMPNNLPVYDLGVGQPTNRTLRMDKGGVCQFCGRMSAQRVEAVTYLWPTQPLMYGECCLAKASHVPPPVTIVAPSIPEAQISPRTIAIGIGALSLLGGLSAVLVHLLAA